MRKSILSRRWQLALIAAAPLPPPALGRVATPDEVAKADISVDPSGVHPAQGLRFGRPGRGRLRRQVPGLPRGRTAPAGRRTG